MDISGALAALIIFSPFFLVIYVLVKRDGGPAFYGHTRIGKGGKSFKCWKFRSMRPDADAVLQELLENDPAARAEWERDFKLRHDPRVTKIGAFLRKTSLDEWPQFYNVLCGEMSLVGPRPVVEDERKYYGAYWKDYLAVKPGITGLWQVSGRNDTGYKRRVVLDRAYVRRWSAWKDIAIIFKTAKVMLVRDGAY